MYLLDLPVEIGTLIFTYLDGRSKIVVYSIVELRGFFAPCLMRRANISRSTLATANTLSLDLFKDYAVNIEELNLSGIQDLTADKLTPYIQKCANLRTLDVTFTKIYLSDLEDICCDSLKNISINYFEPPRKHNKDEVWYRIADVFKRQQFERVHFVVLDYDSEAPLEFMEENPITKDLQITVLFNHYRRYLDMEEQHFSRNVNHSVHVHFEKLYYSFRDCFPYYRTVSGLKGISNLSFHEIEYILIMYSLSDTIDTIYIFVSPIFGRLFRLNCTDTTMNMCSHLPLDLNLDGNIIFKAWNKNSTVFNDDFFKAVLHELRDYFPTYICMNSKEHMKITDAPSHWYCIDCCDSFEEILNDLPEKVTLTNFCRRGSVVRWDRSIKLALELKSFKNITFLGLSDVCTKHDFFSHLFSQCKRLITLDVHNIEPLRLGSYSRMLSLFNCLHLTKSLKNLKLAFDCDIEYGLVFDSLCLCPSLENVYIYEDQRVLPAYEADQHAFTFIDNCYNLYSLFIESDMDAEALNMLEILLRDTAHELGRDHLCIEACTYADVWNPFADVFNPSPLHITR